MSFFAHPAFYPTHSSFLAPVSDDELYYRRVAEEHARRAQTALALAQEVERRRRQAVAQQQPHFRTSYLPTQPHSLHAPIPSYEGQLPPRYEHTAERPAFPAPRSHEQLAREEHERQIEQWLQRRRQRELEEAEFRRLKELERRRDDEMMREMLTALGVDSLNRRRASPEVPNIRMTPQQTSNHPQTPTSQSFESSESASTTSPRSRQPDFPMRLWNALSGGRSDDERASIFEDLGLPVPVYVSLPANAHRPATEQPHTPTQWTFTAQPIPKPQARPPRPTPVPIRVSDPTSTQTLPKPAPSLSPAPGPVQRSPFAHIESIQLKFDTIRASIPDLSDHKRKQEYLAELDKLLTSLDEVESSGLESIRGARKALVRAVEDELDRAEGTKEGEKDDAVEAKAFEEANAEAKTVEELSSTAVEKEDESVGLEGPCGAQPTAEHLSDEVDVQTVSDSEFDSSNPVQPSIEEPANEAVDSAQQTTEVALKEACDVQEVTSGIVPEASTSALQANVMTSEVAVGSSQVLDEASAEDIDEQPRERARQPAATTNETQHSPKARRPRSVEIEEVPDEESLSGSPWLGLRDL